VRESSEHGSASGSWTKLPCRSIDTPGLANLRPGSTVFSIDGSVPDANFERGFYYLDLTDPIGFSGNTTIPVQGVPVPATALPMAIGLGVLGFARRR
jgi:hypothetical protein